MISVPSPAGKHVADSKAAEHPETGRQGRRPYNEPGRTGLRAGHQLSGERLPGLNAAQHQTRLALEFLRRDAGVVCGCISLNNSKWNRNQRDCAKQAAVSALLPYVSDVQEGFGLERKPSAPGIEIVSDSLGKPHLLIDGSEGPSVSFAYEGHTMWVAIGRQGSSVGIDAAQSASFMGNYPFHRVFQEGELGNGREKEEAAALIWSAKEAVVKALGCGFHLVDPLHVRVEKSPGDLEASVLKVYLTDKARERCQLQAKDPVPVWILQHGGMWVSVASFG